MASDYKKWRIVIVPVVLTIIPIAWFLSGKSIEQRRNLCQAAIASGQWEELRLEATEWTHVKPDSADAWMFLARAHQRLGNLDEAVASLQNVPKTSRQWNTAQLAIVELSFGPLNKPQLGAETCEKILNHNPESVVARQRLIFFLAMTRQRVRMIDQIRIAMKLRTESKEAYTYLFFADSLPFTNAASLNSQWLAGSPGSELFEVGRAVYLAETLDTGVSLDNRERALAAEEALSEKETRMRELLEKYPHNIEILAYHLNRARLISDLDRAVELMSMAPVESESDSRFWRAKGWIHARRGETGEAESSYRKAIELHPLDWGTRSLLAQLLQQEQRLEEAAQLRQLVDQANKLRRTIEVLPSADQVTIAVIRDLIDYAEACGDQLFAESLSDRLKQQTSL